MYDLAVAYSLVIMEVVLKWWVTKNKEDTKSSEKTQFTYPLAYLYLHFLRKKSFILESVQEERQFPVGFSDV